VASFEKQVERNLKASREGMKERMTRAKVNARARELDLEAQVKRIWALADDALGLRENEDEENTKTIPFELVKLLSDGKRRTRTIFRIGFDPDEQDARLAICLPFWARKQNRPWTDVLKRLQDELLEAVRQSRLTLLDRGAKEDPRFELSKSTSDILVEAICTMYGEVSQNL